MQNDKKNERVSTKQAARELGISANVLTWRMEQGMFNPPIGYCYPSRTGKTIRHEVYRNMLDKYKGE